MDESKTECAYQLRLKDNQNTELIKDIQKKAKGEKEQLAKTITSLQQDIDTIKRENDSVMSKVKVGNEKTLLEQSDMYKNKLVFEYDKYDKMENAYNKMKDINKKKTEELENSIEERVVKIKNEFDSKLLQYEDEVKAREKQSEDKIKAVEEILKQTEEDADKEILEIKTKYEIELKKEKESNVKVDILLLYYNLRDRYLDIFILQLLGELGILKKKHIAVHKDLEDQKQSISYMNSEHSRLETVIKVKVSTGCRYSLYLALTFLSRISNLLCLKL